MMNDCPWSVEEEEEANDRFIIDLKGKSLTATEKLYIGQQLALGKKPATQLQTKYNLHRNTIRKYKLQYLTGKVPYLKPGRPKVLREAAVNDIVEILKTNRELAEEHEIRRLIRNKHKSSWPNQNEKYVQLSKRTVIRYSKEIQEKVNSTTTVNENNSSSPSSNRLLFQLQQDETINEEDPPPVSSSSSLWGYISKFVLG